MIQDSCDECVNYQQRMMNTMVLIIKYIKLSIDCFEINQFSDLKKLIYLTMVTHELIRL